MREIKFSVIIIFIKCVIYAAGFSYPQLKLLSVIFRHGDREPNDEIGGDLTNVGRLRVYRLGEILRSRYNDFLGEEYDPLRLYARSTEYNRAKASLQLMLAGLFVPRGQEKWHESLDWQPIPFNHVRRKDDILLFSKFCPRFERESERVQSSPDYQKLMDPYREMMSNLSVSAGVGNISSALDMFTLYNNLIATESMKKPLPEWSKDIYPDGLLLNGTYFFYDSLKYTDWMRRVNGGTLLRKIVDDMVNRTDENYSSKRDVYLYSGHEMILVAMMQSLKLWDPHLPEYTSALIFELREDRENYYVKVLYHKGIPPIFKEMQIPGCPTLCPLNRFIELLSDNLPDYEEIICDEKRISFK